MNCLHCEHPAAKHGLDHLKNGTIIIQTYKCKRCDKRFNERAGTPMARLRTPVATVEMALIVRTEGVAACFDRKSVWYTTG